MLLVYCVLAATALVAAGTLRGSRRCALALLALAPVWLLANSPVESTILWSMNDKHGLTLGDLLVVPMIALALSRLVRLRPTRAAQPSRRPVEPVRQAHMAATQSHDWAA
jgi:hypothetical protein